MEFNEALFIGKVKGQLQVQESRGKQVYFTLTVNNRNQNENGQWVDNPIDVPIYAVDKKAELMEQYVVTGQELLIKARYINWDQNGTKQHIFQLLSVGFGFKPRDGGENKRQESQQGPPM